MATEAQSLPRSGSIDVLALVRGVVVVLLAGSVAVPFIPFAGSLSADDLLPLTGVALALAAIAFSTKPVQLDGVTLWLFALALLGILSAGANAESARELLRFAGRSTGRFVFFMCLIVSLRHLLGESDWARRALVGVAVFATLESLFGLGAFVTRWSGPYGLGVIAFPDWSVLKGSVRIQGTFSGLMTEFETDAQSANFLAAYLVMTIPVTVAFAMVLERTRDRLIALAAVAVQVMVLYLTYTRAALIALGAPVLVMGWLLGKKRAAMGMLVLGVLLTLAIPSVRTKIVGEGHNRYALWWASLAMTRDHAAFGVGDGNYDRVLNGNQKYHQNEFGAAQTASHNSVLLSAAHLGVAAGIVHVLLYLALMGAVLGAVRRLDGSDRVLGIGIAGAVAGYLVQDQFNNLAYVPKVATQLWFLFAALGALTDRQDARRLGGAE